MYLEYFSFSFPTAKGLEVTKPPDDNSTKVEVYKYFKGSSWIIYYFCTPTLNAEIFPLQFPTAKRTVLKSLSEDLNNFSCL